MLGLVMTGASKNKSRCILVLFNWEYHWDELGYWWNLKVSEIIISASCVKLIGEFVPVELPYCLRAFLFNFSHAR